MPRFTRRTYIRRYLETPIVIRDHDLERVHGALMFDCCKGGMHFTSDRYIAPGSTIIVSPCEVLAEYFNNPPPGGLRARVVWCRRRAADPHKGFRCGVQFRPGAHHDRQHHPAT
jgi:hypothetical protein